MSSYIQNLSNIFGWVKNVLANNQLPNQPINTLPPASLNSYPSSINGPDEWNKSSNNFQTDFTAFYKAVDYSYNQAVNVISQSQATYQDLLQTSQNLNSQFLSLANNQTQGGGTVTIHGGIYDQVDTDEKWYRNNSMLVADQEMGVFRLDDTGTVSVTHSSLGRNAKFVIEKSSIGYVSQGNLQNILSPSSSTYWVAEARTLGNFVNVSPNYTWGGNLNYGFALLGATYFEKPILCSEYIVDPVVPAPLLVSTISWTPTDLQPFFIETFSNLTKWSTINPTYSATAFASGSWEDDLENEVPTYGTVLISDPIFSNSLEVGIENTLGELGSSCLKIFSNINAPWQGVQSTFQLATATASATSGLTSLSSLGPLVSYKNNRLDIFLKVAGNGKKFQMVVKWQDAAGITIVRDTFSEHTTNYFNLRNFCSYAPTNATQFVIMLGAVGDLYDGYVLFDSLYCSLGEYVYSCNQVVNQKTSIQLPQRVYTTRLSAVLVQMNPTVQKGESQYIIGLKEVDVAYREFVPTGSIISKPVYNPNEIRRFWVNSELASPVQNGLQYIVYPYADSTTNFIYVSPFITVNTGLTQTSNYYQGEYFSIYTNEEYNNGYTDNLPNTNVILLDPSTQIRTFDGTDRNGVLPLPLPVHFRKYKYETIHTFLTNYGVTLSFDPNMQTVFGVYDLVIRNSILQTGTAYTAGTIPATSLAALDGYLPIKVTVKNDNFNAVPDTNGKPSNILVYNVENETLVSTTSTTVDQSVTLSTNGYNVWKSTTTLGSLVTYGYMTQNQLTFDYYSHNLGDLFNTPDLPPFTIVPGANTTTTVAQCVAANPHSVNETTLYSWYTSMVNNRQVSNLTNSTSTTTSVTNNTAYQTAFSPIVNGNSGILLVVSQDGVYVPANNYTVNPDTGLIVFNQPTTGTITASYSYSVKPYSMTDQQWFSTSLATNTVLTRNMTDYDAGTIPSLNPFDPNPASPTYYPVIEYYIDSINQLHFSRDFFAYGDLPATIIVEWDTLAIQPRFGVLASRIVGPTVSPQVSSVTLGFQDVSAALQA